MFQVKPASTGLIASFQAKAETFGVAPDQVTASDLSALSFRSGSSREELFARHLEETLARQSASGAATPVGAPPSQDAKSEVRSAKDDLRSVKDIDPSVIPYVPDYKLKGGVTRAGDPTPAADPNAVLSIQGSTFELSAGDSARMEGIMAALPDVRTVMGEEMKKMSKARGKFGLF